MTARSEGAGSPNTFGAVVRCFFDLGDEAQLAWRCEPRRVLVPPSSLDVRLSGLTRSQPRRLERSESKVDMRFGGRI